MKKEEDNYSCGKWPLFFLGQHLSCVLSFLFNTFIKIILVTLSFLWKFITPNLFPPYTMNFRSLQYLLEERTDTGKDSSSIRFGWNIILFHHSSYFTLYICITAWPACPLDWEKQIHLLAQGFQLLVCLAGLFAHQSHLDQDDQAVLLNPLVLKTERKEVKTQ